MRHPKQHHIFNDKNIIYSQTTRENRQRYKRSVLNYKANKTDKNLKLLLRSKKDFNKAFKKDRERKKFEKLIELNKAKADNDSKRYWELLNQDNKKKRKVFSKIEATHLKKQIEDRDLQMSLQNNERVNKIDDEDTFLPQTINEDPNNILDSVITIEEVSKTLKVTRNSRSSGPDGFVNEILKQNSQDIVPILTKTFNNILNGDDLPWNSSWIVPIHKKGKMENYLPIDV